MYQELLEYNRQFVQGKGYMPYRTTKFPDRKLAILTCMDTRLTLLLPAALGLRNGEVKMVKNAGGVVSSPYDTSVRSLLIAVLELGVEEIMVIGHTDCGVCGMQPGKLLEDLVERGIPESVLRQVGEDHVDLLEWLSGFACVEQAVSNSVHILREHPLMPKHVEVHGFIMDTETGKLNPVGE